MNRRSGNEVSFVATTNEEDEENEVKEKTRLKRRMLEGGSRELTWQDRGWEVIGRRKIDKKIRDPKVEMEKKTHDRNFSLNRQACKTAGPRI